jgi:hypothetical protein
VVRKGPGPICNEINHSVRARYLRSALSPGRDFSMSSQNCKLINFLVLTHLRRDYSGRFCGVRCQTPVNGEYA